MDAIIRRDADTQPQISHRDYTVSLLQYAALHNLLTEARQTELRDALQSAAAERAAAYTKGRSTTVTKKQAEAFFASVFCQLDAALLALGNDALAIEALRTESFAKLLDAGLCRMLTLYDEAKADFRRAYQLTEPVQTSFFRDLLKGFAQFSTEYDARFHAKDAEQYVDFCYPLLHGSKPDEDGLFAVCAYYRALKLEGEFLRLFPMDDIHTLMQRYAARFRTVPEMIAENIAELVFRHWIAGALTGCPDNAILLPEETADALIAQFSVRTKQDLEAAMQQAIAELPLTEDAMQYLTDAVPALAAAMEPHITDRNLQGWFA